MGSTSDYSGFKKLAFALTEVNGTIFHNLSISETKPAESIIKLTPDTLIYSALGYYGKENIYGHDEWYFVKEN